MTSRTGNSRQCLCPRAFTLVELTIVVFIMAVMTAVAVPYFARYYNDSKLTSAARTFVTTCQLARLEAVTKQCEAHVQVDLDRQTYCVMLSRSTNEESVLASETFEVPDNIRVISVQVGEDPAQHDGQAIGQFYPNGTCAGVTAEFRSGEKKPGIAVWVDPVTSRATTYGVK